MSNKTKTDHKAQVLAWFEDNKRGWVKPPEPFTLMEREGWAIVTLPVLGDEGNHVGCKMDVDVGWQVWHTLHTLLRVGEWTMLREGFPNLPTMELYLEARRLGLVRKMEVLYFLLAFGEWTVRVDIMANRIYIYTFDEEDEQVSHAFLQGDAEFASVATIKEWVANNWPEDDVPGFFKSGEAQP